MAETVNPRSMLLPSDSNDKVTVIQRKVLERIDWLNSLRLIFNRAARDPSLHSSSQAITVEAFLNTLLESVESLPLQEESEFSRKSAVQYFSFEEIFTAFEQEFGKTISWDFVIEKVIAMDAVHHFDDSTGPHSIDVNGETYSELVAIARKSTSSPEPKPVVEEQSHSPRHPTYLRIPSTPNSPHTSREFSNVQDYIAPDIIQMSDEGEEETEAVSPLLASYNRFPRSPELKIAQKNSLNMGYSKEAIPEGISQKLTNFAFATSLCSLSLAGCSLSIIPEGLPGSLRVLNLAENRIKSIENLDDCRHLHFLNLSFNAVESLSGLFRLRELFELYLAGNALTKVTKVFQLQNLALLDLSKNKIASLEGLIDLAQNRHLLVLRLVGNLLYRKMYSTAQVRNVLPQVQYLDPPGFLDHSAYRLAGEEAFGRVLHKKSGPAESIIIEKSDVLDLSPTAHKCAKRLGNVDLERKSLRTSLNFSVGMSQSLRSSTVRLF